MSKNSITLRVIGYFILGIFLLLCSFGCKNGVDSDVVEVKVNEQTVFTESKYNVFDWVVELNKLSGLSMYKDGIGIDVNDNWDVYRVYMTEELENMLPLACENYNVSTNYADNITSDQVKSVINDNFSAFYEEELESGSYKSHFLYKFLSWCGSSCKETAVYNPDSGWEVSKIEKSIYSGEETNANVVQSQVNWAKEGKVSPYKFKWQ